MKIFITLIFLSLSLSSFANMNDLSVTDACKMQLSKHFSAGEVEQLISTADIPRHISEVAFVLRID